MPMAASTPTLQPLVRSEISEMSGRKSLPRYVFQYVYLHCSWILFFSSSKTGMGSASVNVKYRKSLPLRFVCTYNILYYITKQSNMILRWVKYKKQL